MTSNFWSRSGAILTAALLVTGLAATTVAASADDKDRPSITEQQNPRCGPGQKQLANADDRFDQGCIPGEELAQLDDSGTELAPGKQDSEDMKLLANLPKNGAFEGEEAYSSDLAFQSHYAFAGNYNGFTVYDIKKPRKPVQLAQVVCPGSQNDVSVNGDLLILSTDSSRSNDSCENTEKPATKKNAWEGVKVFDISDPAEPQYVSSVETACGSHTHSLAPSHNGKTVYAYVSSYSPNETYPDCQPPHDFVSVVKIPVKNPANASLANEATLFPDGGNGDDNYSSETSGCHDITAYPEKDIAAGACMGDGVLMDISDRENPVITDQVRDMKNFAFWHSATFNNDGTKVVFTDELGGGGAPTCNDGVGSERGADGIYNIVDGKLKFRSYYKIPRINSNTENCVAHNGSLIPVEGKDIMVQAWYQGGISVWDFTKSSKPKEIAWFDRGALDKKRLILGGSWSAYYYNGYVYSNDIQQGLDVLKIQDPAVASAEDYRYDELNPQSQPSFNG